MLSYKYSIVKAICSLVPHLRRCVMETLFPVCANSCCHHDLPPLLLHQRWQESVTTGPLVPVGKMLIVVRRNNVLCAVYHPRGVAQWPSSTFWSFPSLDKRVWMIMAVVTTGRKNLFCQTSWTMENLLIL